MARIFFMHIAKTAGTSANAFFEKQYSEDKIVTHVEKFNEKEFVRKNLLKYHYISGHVGILRFEPFDRPKLYDYITFIREPIAQLHSHLKWMKRQTTDARFKNLIEANPHIKVLSEKINESDLNNPMVLEGFFESLEGPEMAFFDNCQSRYFIQGLGGKAVTQHFTNLAIENMMKRFRFVGISEEFEKSLSAISLIYGFDNPRESIIENVNDMEPLFDLENKEIVDVLREVTKFDRQLYYRALQRFEQQYNNLYAGLG